MANNFIHTNTKLIEIGCKQSNAISNKVSAKQECIGGKKYRDTNMRMWWKGKYRGPQ